MTVVTILTDHTNDRALNACEANSCVPYGQIQLFTEFILLIMTADIDDRDHCLQGRSIVRISVGVNATALCSTGAVDLLATLKIALVD